MPASSSVAERIRGRASAAPLPSPSRRSRSRQRIEPELLDHHPWPGSADRWLAINRGPMPGAMVAATSAAAPVMNPSRTTGDAASAAARIAPTSAAISNPPTAASAPSGSSAPGSMPLERPLDHRRPCGGRPSSSSPVPRPVTSAGGRPVSAATSALAAVVFPMPISPTAIVSIPPAISSLDDPSPDLDGRERLVAASWRARPSCRGSRRQSGLGRDARPRRRPRSPAVRRHRSGDPDVDDDELRPGSVGQDIDGRPATDEVGDHLRRHVARVGRDAARRDPVVAGERRPPRAGRPGASATR